MSICVIPFVHILYLICFEIYKKKIVSGAVNAYG
jgi:hypothetical protein